MEAILTVLVSLTVTGFSALWWRLGRIEGELKKHLENGRRDKWLSGDR